MRTPGDLITGAVVLASFLFAALATACRPTSTVKTKDVRQTSARAETQPRAQSDPLDPPDTIPGFVTESTTHDAAFDRRSYARGGARVTVTIARMPMTAAGYGNWVRQSEGAYPQASLDVPPDSANGFYQCEGGAGAGGCSLLIQLRSGVHVEVRGTGGATRRDVDEVTRALPLRRLAASDEGDAPAR